MLDKELNPTSISTENPYLSLFLIPNLIGYLRIGLLGVVILIALKHPIFTFVAFFMSANLDAVDGYLARKLNQESRIGTILDYAIDRTSDTVLFLILAMVYPKAWGIFCVLLMLDIFSHICQVYSTVFSKLNNHKLLGKNQGTILRLYYTNRSILYWACSSHDLWLACLYLHHYFPESWISWLSFVFLPGFLFKILIHFLQIVSVFKTVSQSESMII